MDEDVPECAEVGGVVISVNENFKGDRMVAFFE
jgi:hypothetical protein